MTEATVNSDLVNIEVNGVAVKAHKGENIIRATDREGIYVPRFCYHDKLPIAANCRMCLVEVEKAPKPLPACATPVAEGMKIFTHSSKPLVRSAR
jgi:NADH-quinone oxidoreductase subunit G